MPDFNFMMLFTLSKPFQLLLTRSSQLRAWKVARLRGRWLAWQHSSFQSKHSIIR